MERGIDGMMIICLLSTLFLVMISVKKQSVHEHAKDNDNEVSQLHSLIQVRGLRPPNGTARSTLMSDDDIRSCFSITLYRTCERLTSHMHIEAEGRVWPSGVCRTRLDL